MKQASLITSFLNIIFLNIIFLLLLFAPSSSAAVARQSHPHLDMKRLQQAYKRHAESKEFMTSETLGIWKVTVSDPTWSPDGHYAFYTISEGPIPHIGGEWMTLFAVRRNGSHTRRLFEWQHPGENHPEKDSIQWSPDSRRIIMLVLNYSPASSVNADGVKLLDLDPKTGEKRELSRALDGEPGTGQVLRRPGYYSFSPNAKYLLLTLGGGRQNLTNKRLVRIEYATGKRKVLTSAKMASFAARWAPDSTHIAYIAIPDSGGVNSDNGLPYEEQVKHQHLYIMSTVGNQKRCLVQDSGYFEEEPSWSADGRQLFFVRCKPTGDRPSSLWKIHPDGTGLTLVRALPPN